MLKRILVALSGTPYTPIAVEQALALARHHEAEVTGVTITDLQRLASVGPVPAGAGAAAHDLIEHRIQITEQRIHEAIADFQSACGKAGVTCQVVHETEDPLEELRSLWRYHDLTVFGLRGLFEYGVLHNPSDRLVELLQHGVQPILAVSPTFREIRRILIAYNGSMEAARSMKNLVFAGLWPDAVVKIICFDSKVHHPHELLNDAASYCRAHGLSVETELVSGDPKKDLLTYASGWNADLIAMGSSNRRRVFQHVLGDTCLHAIMESTIPLFLSL